MNTAAKLSAYGAALALLVAGAYAVGTAVGPLTAPSGVEAAGHGDAHSGGTVAEAATDQPAELASSRGGYVLTPTDPTPTAGPFSFRMVGPDGPPVTAFDAGLAGVMTTGQLIIVDHVVALLSVVVWFASGAAAATRRARLALGLLAAAVLVSFARVTTVAMLAGRGWWVVQGEVPLG